MSLIINRLKGLLRRLKLGDVPPAVFQQDLLFAIEVLESCYLDDIKWVACNTLSDVAKLAVLSSKSMEDF